MGAQRLTLMLAPLALAGVLAPAFGAPEDLLVTGQYAPFGDAARWTDAPAPDMQPRPLRLQPTEHLQHSRALHPGFLESLAQLRLSRGLIWVAYVGGLLALGASVLLLLRVFWLRAQRMIEEARAARLWHRWRPILSEWLANGSGPMPNLRPEDRLAFLTMWTEAHEGMRGDAKRRLNALGRALDLERIALEMMELRDLGSRLWAVLALGNLESWAAWPRLHALALEPDPWMSFAAARAMVRIHAGRATRELMPHFVLRPDWPLSRLLTGLRGAGRDAVSTPLSVAIATTPDERLPRALSFVSAARSEDLRPAILYRLQHSQDPQVIAAVLRHYRDPRDLPLLRQYCDHPEWFVRVQAVRAVGMLGGGPEDLALLLRRLEDEAWWVAFRAAEALASPRFAPTLTQLPPMSARAQEMLGNARQAMANAA
jgi:hypothetical protein